MFLAIVLFINRLSFLVFISSFLGVILSLHPFLVLVYIIYPIQRLFSTNQPSFPLVETPNPPRYIIMNVYTENDPDHDWNSDSDTDTDSEYYDSDEDDEYADIAVQEMEFESTAKRDGGYYIGLTWIVKNEQHILMNGAVSASTFLKNEYTRVCGYLRESSLFYVCPTQTIDIMKLTIRPDGFYEVAVKTYWIRIIQRRWRTLYRERKRVIAMRMQVQNQEYFQTHGKYITGTRHLPSIRDMFNGFP